MKPRPPSGYGPSLWAPAPRPVLLSHAQAVRLLQPGLHHPHMDRREPPAAVGWGPEGGWAGGWEPGGSQLGSPTSAPHQGPGAGQGRGPSPAAACCPLLGARLDSGRAHPCRLLQLNGAPQALTFCSNNGDLVLALGSRLCLVPHRLYLPTSYLVKVCGEHRLGRRGCVGR